MKEEIKSILSSLPKRIIIALLIIALSIIIILIGYIGRGWFKTWEDTREQDKQEIIDVVTTEIQKNREEFVTKFDELHMVVSEIKDKQIVIGDAQTIETRKQIKLIESVYKNLHETEKKITDTVRVEPMSLQPSNKAWVENDITANIVPKETHKKKL